MTSTLAQYPDRSPNGFPFAALVGQEKMILALLLLAVDPNLGGVLLIGQKGSAKSTAARGLAELLPMIMAVAGCPFNCPPDQPENMCPGCQAKHAQGRLTSSSIPQPFLNLPLGATEDRVVGGVDFEAACRTGRPELRPGLLGLANRGFLYVDEVNLLEPYLAHLLLDAVETGRLAVEREGLSLNHPSKAALIGSMNPEEGTLGPQLADRFALTVYASGETDPETRALIVRRRLAFEADPVGFREKWYPAGQELAARLVQARKRLKTVETPEKTLRLAASLARQVRAGGHRGDLALVRAARALAAWRGQNIAAPSNVEEIADLALAARRVEKINRPQVQIIQGRAPEQSRSYESTYIPPSARETRPKTSPGEPAGAPLVERVYKSNETFEITTPVRKKENGPRDKSGRRSARPSPGNRGRYFRSSPERLGRPLALDATMRAAAPHQKERRRPGSFKMILTGEDFREKVFRTKTGRLVVFVVDASGSVGSLYRMAEAKAAALSLLSEAYLKRDKVGLIAFHGAEARVLLPPTNSVETAGRLLEDLPTGGKTPLAAALVSLGNLFRVEMARDPGLNPLAVLMTDGRPNVPLTPGIDPFRETLQLAAALARDVRLRFLLVDTDKGHYSDYKLTTDLARTLGAPRLTLEDLRHGGLKAWLEQVT